MKKITFLMFLFLGAALVQAQTNLVTNGDFEAATIDPWFGNAANKQTEGGNSFNFANVETAGNAFDVNLSQELEIVQNRTYTLTFEASSDRERSMLAGIGLNGPPFDADVKTVNLTTTTQTFTLTLSSATFGSPQSRVIFDMGADTGTVVIDNVVLIDETGDSGGAGAELVVNGDFEAATIDPWFGNAANKQTEGNNSFNFANVEQAGDAFAVNLSQVLTIEQGETYTMIFDASSDRNRTILAGIGLNEAPFDATVESVALTTENQTFTLVLTATNFGGANSRVIFDMGAEVGVVVLDNVSLVKNAGGGGGGNTDAVPTVSAPTPPARNSQDYFSVYSDAYADQEGVVFGAFGVGSQDFETVIIDGDNFIKATLNQPASQFLFADWGTTVNTSDKTMFHFDYWTDTSLRTGLIVNPKFSNHVGNDGETSAFELNNPANTFGEWVSIDIPISTMNSIDAPNQRRDALRQFVLTVAGADNGSRVVYLDNIYLYKASTASVDEVDGSMFKVYPNPAQNVWNIESLSSPISSVAVYDVTGKLVIEHNEAAVSATIDASGLSQGLYIAKISSTDGEVRSIKLTKE
ncbi:T9SS type A sorting domain-containing protein [Nonlabens marinus]|uniref:Glycosyl hydrolase, family 16 n=1 Tax=Nonlabens marinus S1-08 TaxID=1454201 RepID=W8VTZ8_9FLAO|nr:carbohydrate binding domain-containing protein [Nonlabens marinus]BAO54148.1 glycosyl hydrolase, family 16 [Nonlabens marinus S1-08]